MRAKVRLPRVDKRLKALRARDANDRKHQRPRAQAHSHRRHTAVGSREIGEPMGSRAATTESSASSADTVSITHLRLLMSKLEELVQRAPPVDEERVAAIKDAIASGTYELDDQRIADRLLKFERDVLG